MTGGQRIAFDRVKNARGSLSLGAAQIGDAEAQAIAEALKVNTTLKDLCLWENQIGDTGAQAIAEALKVNKTLIALYLWMNQIGDGGAQAIAEALKANKSMTSLSLAQNQISDAGAQAIADTLKVNKTLCSLDLQQNQIGDAGGLAIAEALKVNTRLEFSSNLTYNCIGKAGFQAIREARVALLTRLDSFKPQLHFIAFSLFPRMATAEDLQTVFRLLTRGQELEDQPTSLPALPAEIAELIMDEAHYWQGVQHTKRQWFGDDTPNSILKVTVPQGVNGNSIRMSKALFNMNSQQNRLLPIGVSSL
ncbi:hypothetical protein CAOG_007674 [Capsaspora owczarzaki ATCC 30864]|uniref:NOD3 protein n=1 Tax=Capsaspora owczarzaki (strain ATCC 30864) TaxID=595528 RepID=A0A0D2WX08_CAPO3|nr:hypothetical protein CAOG_007674 [Capsaspora owczarzaki ATCC 30864]